MLPTQPIHRALLPVTAVFLTGLVVGAQWPDHWTIALVVVVVAAVGLIWCIGRHTSAIFWPLLFCFGVGYLCIQPWLTTKMPAQHVTYFTGNGWWQIEGRVAEPPLLNDGRIRFILSVNALSQAGQRNLAMGKVSVTARGRGLPQVGRGDVVILTGRLKVIRNFANPGGFDYERYMALRGVRVRTYVRKGTLKVLSPASTMSWQGYVDQWRQTLLDRMNVIQDGQNRAALQLLKALMMGRKDQVSQDDRRAFRAAGVSHVLAISGLHIGLVAAAAFALFRWLFAWLPAMRTLGWTRKSAAMISMMAVLYYALLAGFSPSTQRATIMVAVVLAGHWVGRRHDWLNTLAIAALIILIIHPPAVMSISFQLSFAAVLAILVGIQKWPGRPSTAPSDAWRRWTRRWLTFMWVSGLALGGTLPLVITYFNETSLVGLATNVVVIPLVGMVVIPAGLSGVLVCGLSPWLAGILWHIAIAGIQCILWVVHAVAQWPWSTVRWVTPTLWEVLLYYVCLGILLGWRSIPKRGWVAAVLCLLWAVDISYWGYQRYGRQDLRVTVLDVGQGSAHVLQLPGGFTVLLDGGGFSDNTIFDVGQRIVAPFLWQQKIKCVDLMILSHPNSDHLNGLLYILRHFHVAEIWSNGQPADSFGYRQWRQLINEKDIRHYHIGALTHPQIRQGVELNILGPAKGFMDRESVEPWRNVNNNSLVVHVRLNQVSLLFSSDIVHHAEKDLLSRVSPDKLRSTILMVPHHGSRYSSGTPFLKAVAPCDAIVSAGWQNRFGFPHQAVLDRLAKIKARVWCTSQCGAVQITTDGRTYRMRTCRPECRAMASRCACSH